MEQRSQEVVEKQLMDLIPALGREKATVRLEKLPGDASNRCYYRLFLDDNQQPGSMIVMVLADPDPHKGAEEAEKLKAQLDELPFLNVARFFSDLGVRVPRIYHYDREGGFIFLEDFGDMLLEEAFEECSDDKLKDLYRHAVENLVVINYRGAAGRSDDCIAFLREFDDELFKWEFEHFIEYGIESKGIKISDEDRAVFDKAFTDISKNLAALPQVVCHRDYHSRNLIVLNDELGIIDFQDALLGPAPYDLASLLKDSYVCLDDDLIDELVALYIEKANEQGAQLDPQEFRRNFDLQSIQRNLKAAGRFDYIDQVKGNPNFLKHIPHTLDNVRRNMAKYPFLHPLKATLGKYVPALVD
jgi:N-acetylmuramate 1-kinase